MLGVGIRFFCALAQIFAWQLEIRYTVRACQQTDVISIEFNDKCSESVKLHNIKICIQIDSISY